jgi:hypothetical protein
MSADNMINLIQQTTEQHAKFWNEQMPDLKNWRRAYLGQFYEGTEYDNSQIRIQTSDGYGYIEGYIASLFSKAPAVVVGPDIKPEGDYRIVQEISNRLLFNKSGIIENASRMALIYPMSFFKLIPCKAESILDQIELIEIPPWEIILDREAGGWDSQRFIGHIYYLPLKNAKEKFGNKRFKACEKNEYFDTVKRLKQSSLSLPEEYQYIHIVEMYDLINDKLIFWSPNYSNGESAIEISDIPIRSHKDSPLSPIIPLYYSRVPDRPLDGYSTLSRVYDQLFEKNIIRSFWANAVRRDSRQYLYKSDVIDEESVAKITAGIDGLMVPIEADSLAGIIAEVPSSSISANHDRYLAAIEQDLAKGSIMAPFTRGQATGSTATEINVLAQYTASEIGRMARERDSAIEMIAYVYSRIIALFTEEDSEEVILVDGRPEIITANKLQGKFKISALDAGATPLTREAKRKQIVELIPILGNLGVDPKAILTELVRLYDLPESFTIAPPAPQQPSSPEIIEASPDMPNPEQMLIK